MGIQLEAARPIVYNGAMTATITAIAAAILGVFIGVLSGLLGVGGGTIMVPMYRLAFGMSAIASTATSLFTIIPTSISGLITHLRRKTCIPKLGLALGIGGACTSPLGVWLASQSPSWAVMIAAAIVIAYSSFNMIQKVRALPKANGKGSASATDNATVRANPAPPPQPALTSKQLAQGVGIGGACTSPLGVWLASQSPSWAVMLAAAIVIAYSSFNMIQKVRALPKANGKGNAGAPENAAAPASSASPQPPVLTPKQLAQGVAIGLVTGVASGYVGLGGGFLMVPLMLAWLNIPMKLASGTSLLAIMLLAIPGAITQGVLGNIDYLAGIATAVGTIPGAYLGARLVSRVPERTLRLVFAVFLAVGAVLLVVKELALFV